MTFTLDPDGLRRKVIRPLRSDADEVSGVKFGANPTSGADTQDATDAVMAAMRSTRNDLADWLRTRATNVGILIQDFTMLDGRSSVDIGKMHGDYERILRDHHVSDADLNNDGRITRDEFERLWAQDDKEDVDDPTSDNGRDGDHDNDEDDKTYGSYDAFGEDRTPGKKGDGK